MPTPRCLIFGAGSQAKVVIDLLRASGSAEVVGCVEIGQDPARVGTQLLGIPVICQLDGAAAAAARLGADCAVAAIGDNKLRLELLEMAESLGLKLPALRHPSSVVASGAVVGAGCIISALAFVGVEAHLGRGVIINTSAGVDHDCRLGDGVHVAVGARCAGNVRVGDRATLGAGCVVIPGISVGAGATVGAGAAVVKDVAAGAVVVGVPARGR